MYSTVPPWLQRAALPLIDALTGAPGEAFPHTQLRSGMAHRQGSRTIAANRFLSGLLSGRRVFVTAFPHGKNLSHFLGKVNPSGKEKPWQNAGPPPLKKRRKKAFKMVYIIWKMKNLLRVT